MHTSNQRPIHDPVLSSPDGNLPRSQTHVLPTIPSNTVTPTDHLVTPFPPCCPRLAPSFRWRHSTCAVATRHIFISVPRTSRKTTFIAWQLRWRPSCSTNTAVAPLHTNKSKLLYLCFRRMPLQRAGLNTWNSTHTQLNLWMKKIGQLHFQQFTMQSDSPWWKTKFNQHEENTL